MDLEELKTLAIDTRNSIVTYNNKINSNYVDIDNKLRYLKSKGVKITRDVISLLVSVSILLGSATYIGVKTHNDRKSKLEYKEYTIEEYSNKRKVDYLTAYFGYILLLIVIYNGVCFVKGNTAFIDFFNSFREDVKEFKSGVNEGTILFRSMRENVMYLYQYILQYKAISECVRDIISDNPYMEGEELIIKIDSVLSSIDIEEILENNNEKVKILG